MNHRLFLAAVLAGFPTAVPRACAQSSAFRLDLRIVGRSGTGAASDPLIDLHGSMITFLPGQAIRLELRYRITDLNTSDTITARGLSSGIISIGHNAPTAAGVMRRADLSTDQSGDNGSQPQTGAVDPDGSGIFDAGNVTGLINEFRGRLTDPDGPGPLGPDDGPWNGDPADPATHQLTSNPFTIQTTATSAAAVNNHRSDSAPGTQMWGLYAWWFDPSPDFRGDVTFTASAVADPVTGDRFAYYPRIEPIPVEPHAVSPFATDGVFTLHVVPAPHTLSLLALGILHATRFRNRPSLGTPRPRFIEHRRNPQEPSS